jgi:hypothetical protein
MYADTAPACIGCPDCLHPDACRSRSRLWWKSSRASSSKPYWSLWYAHSTRSVAETELGLLAAAQRGMEHRQHRREHDRAARRAAHAAADCALRQGQSAVAWRCTGTSRTHARVNANRPPPWQQTPWRAPQPAFRGHRRQSLSATTLPTCVPALRTLGRAAALTVASAGDRTSLRTSFGCCPPCGATPRCTCWLVRRATTRLTQTHSPVCRLVLQRHRRMRMSPAGRVHRHAAGDCAQPGAAQRWSREAAAQVAASRMWDVWVTATVGGITGEFGPGITRMAAALAEREEASETKARARRLAAARCARWTLSP